MERPKELPRAVVDERTLSRHEARRAADEKVRSAAIGFGAQALALLSNMFSHRAGGSGGIVLRGAISTRPQAQILGELNAFYAQRQRPWRPKSNAARVRRRAYTAPRARAGA